MQMRREDNGRTMSASSMPGLTAERHSAEARRLRNAYESWFKDALPAGGFRRLPSGRMTTS